MSVKGVKVNITIRDHSTGQYCQIPVIPEKITYTSGDAIYDSAKIVNLGTIDFFNGVDLDGISWDCFFPARYDPSYCSFKHTKTPKKYRDLFLKWKNEGTELQLVCSAAGINKRVTLRSFPWKYEGFEGDITYSVTFKEKKIIRPRKIKIANPTATTVTIEKESLTPLVRAAAPVTETPKTYTVKSGDCLCSIAQKVGVSWETIYNNNKSVIGSNPNLIYPGQVLTI